MTGGRHDATELLNWRDKMRGHAQLLVPPLGSASSRADLLQTLKAVIGAVAGWVVAHDVLGLQSAFLAPWMALLTVHATVYRSFTRGSQAVAATIMGVVISFVLVTLIAPLALALGLALLLGLFLARIPFLRNDGSTVATTALFIITTGQADQGPMLLDRLGCTGIGVVAGVLVNVLVFAPLDQQAARAQVDAVCRALGDLLGDIARELVETDGDVDAKEWIERSRRIDERLDHAWHLVRHAREARIGNPRPNDLDPDAYASILARLEDGIDHARAIARTIDQSSDDLRRWSGQFRTRWVPLLEAVGDRLTTSPDFDVASLRPDLKSLITDLSGDGLASDQWPVYGSLIDSTINIVDVLDDVMNSYLIRT